MTLVGDRTGVSVMVSSVEGLCGGRESVEVEVRPLEAESSGSACVAWVARALWGRGPSWGLISQFPKSFSD